MQGSGREEETDENRIADEDYDRTVSTFRRLSVGGWYNERRCPRTDELLRSLFPKMSCRPYDENNYSVL